MTMVSVLCPWCDRRLVAADGDILSGALTVHFHRDHGLVVPDPDQLRGGQEGHLSSLSEIEGTNGDESETRGGSEAYGARITERGGDLYGVTGPPHTIAVQRAAKMPFVQCPLCGFEVRGKDEGELSQNLKGHMRENNELEIDE
ncbi:MAG: hypothetical protein SA339_11100 [Methanomassiliicoccus sp.]|nr:hypothetical protein [Methanomassiliicoccus sp.]